jgi:hypothetical protein
MIIIIVNRIFFNILIKNKVNGLDVLDSNPIPRFVITWAKNIVSKTVHTPLSRMNIV